MKDCVAVAGIPITCGSRILAGYVPAEDSVVGERILRGGGEIVAITNMDDLAFSGGGDSSCYGATLNPWDESRTAGGSSGGSAAALFYDGFDVCVGGDQGGSIRVPAAWCGVVGLKPTHGLVPYVGHRRHRPGHRPLRPSGANRGRRGGLLDAIAGAHEWDPRQQRVPVADYSAAVGGRPTICAGQGSASSPRASERERGRAGDRRCGARLRRAPPRSRRRARRLSCRRTSRPAASRSPTSSRGWRA